MSQPFIFISTFRLKDGTLDAFKEMCIRLVEMVESSEPPSDRVQPVRE